MPVIYCYLLLLIISYLFVSELRHREGGSLGEERHDRPLGVTLATPKRAWPQQAGGDGG